MNYVVEYTNRSEFCDSCHIMDPFYASWQRGTHAGVACVQCHYPPDIEGKLWTKYQGLSQVASYVTDTASTRPSGHVEDASCLRSGCHSEDQLGAPKPGKVRFDHGPHLNPASDADRLRCTTCHAQVTVEKHMSLDTQPCFLCHLKGDETDGANELCQTCHEIPAVSVAGDGISFNHADIVGRGLDCSSCHANVTVGRGEVERVRCLSCHGSEKELSAFANALANADDRDRLHRSHVSGHAVECRSCHQELKHGTPPPDHSRMERGDCASCHGGHHDEVAAFLKGLDGSAGHGTASLMGAVGLSCESCHVPGIEPEESCHRCHGSGTTGMVAEWREWIDTSRQALTDNIERVRAALGDDARADGAAVLDRALAELDFVTRVRGAHNILRTQEIHRSVQGRIEAVAAGAAPGVELRPFDDPRATDASGCRTCHVSKERSGVHEGLKFSHGVHLEKSGLGCGDCHDSAARHGALSIDKRFCAECHHQESEDCSRCHAETFDFFQGKGIDGLTDLPSPKGEQVPCIACHTDLTSEADHVARSRAMCVECHDESYGPKQDVWMEEESTLVVELGRILTEAEVALAEARVDDVRRADLGGRVVDARARLVQIRRGRFVHNPERARQIAASIRGIADEVARLLKESR